MIAGRLSNCHRSFPLVDKSTTLSASRGRDVAKLLYALNLSFPNHELCTTSYTARLRTVLPIVGNTTFKPHSRRSQPCQRLAERALDAAVLFELSSRPDTPSGPGRGGFRQSRTSAPRGGLLSKRA